MSRRLATLHVIGGRKLGGAERFFTRLVNALARRGEAVAAVTVAGGEIDAALAPQVRRFHAPLAGVWDLWSRWRVGRAVRTFQPAIVQTYMGRATRLTRLPPGRPAVHLARLGGYYNLKGYRHAHAWVGNTRGIRDYLVAEGLPAGRVFHIGNFVDPAPTLPRSSLEDLRRRWQVPHEARVVLGLGRLHPNKGFVDLLEAFASLPRQWEGHPLWLVMVGEGPLRDTLGARASQLGIADRLVWAGWQYDPAPWYQMADLFVCSSRHEPLGNVILEAWANRVPVLTTRAQGPLELVEDGVDGLLAPVADAPALGRALIQALAMPSARWAQMTAAGQAKVDRLYSEQAVVAAYLELYGRLADTAGIRPPG